MPEEFETWNNKNLYKCADMKVHIEVDNDSLDKENPDNRLNELRQKIEPWLTALFQSEHLSLLTGAGLSSAIHYIASGSAGSGMNEMQITKFKDQITLSADNAAKKAGRGDKGNIEDQIRVINELIRGLDILTSEIFTTPNYFEFDSDLNTLKEERDSGISSFAEAILKSESNIVNSTKLDASEYLMNFLLSFASRNATRERLNLFTTNYDRVIEFGAELAGLHLIDRFVGSISPIFRSSRLNIDLHYNPPGVRGEPRYLEGVVNFTKLHGSIDWLEENGVVRRFALPYGAEDISIYNYKQGSLMIYPNSSKDRETSEYPYVELFRDMASAIIRPNSTIVTYGYSFGDDHINRVIYDMLTIPSTHLVIIAFDDTGNRIQRFFRNSRRSTQITLLMGKHFGDIKTLVDYYLPKAAIDKTTYKMVDLLRARGVFIPEKEVVNKKTEGGI